MPHDQFSQRLLAWYDQHGRKQLPWQRGLGNRKAAGYRVWLSEIMLQQTQVATVIPYFKTFLHHYPSVEALAAAPLDEVLHHWSGLGYYARARNLHKTARIIARDCQGKFPHTVEALEQLPGIGRSTAGAIASLAFQQRAVILDGNVKRVLARYHAVRGAIDNNKTLDTLWELADSHTPHTRVHHYTQAIMDLGATLCTRSKPRCEACPLATHCAARQEGKPERYPRKGNRKAIPTRETQMLLILNRQQEVLLAQRAETGIWGGLWSFPEVAVGSDPVRACRQEYALAVRHVQTLPSLSHSFTHYKLVITPQMMALKGRPGRARSNALWYNVAAGRAPRQAGLPVPVSKLLKSLAAHLKHSHQ